MIPLEVTFLLLVFIWGMVGAIRGFAKEIGASIAVILAMTSIKIFGPTFITQFNKIATKVSSLKIEAGGAVPAGADSFCYYASQDQFLFYSVAFGAVVFMGYQGETFGLPTSVGKVPSQIVGIFAGLANGYLIAGNLWWFLEKCAKYSAPVLNINGVGTLSSTANTIRGILPYNLIGEPVLLLGLLFLLLILRIAK